jgi:alanine racemase
VSDIIEDLHSADRGEVLHSSCVTLSERAYARNIRFLQGVIGPHPRFCSVIKGNAYGHSIAALVPMAERQGIEQFAVFSSDEAALAIKARTNPETEIMIMGFIAPRDLSWAVELGISFFVFDLDRLRESGEVAAGLGRPARIHLEIETGLNRTGLEEQELSVAIEHILAHPDRFAVEGICTHYAGAESEANYRRIHDQIQRFDQADRRVRDAGVNPRYRHTACSAAALVHPETRQDLVRIGIAQYGFWPSQETRLRFQLQSGREEPPARDPLRRVMRWTSHVMDVRQYGPGHYLGYGMGYLTTRQQRIAAVPVGYHHGFSRGLSNLGYVLIRGRRAPVVGSVNMNMLLAEITGIPGVTPGDEVVIIGKQERREISVGSFGDLTGHLNYEILARIPIIIPRVVAPE